MKIELTYNCINVFMNKLLFNSNTFLFVFIEALKLTHNQEY